MPSRIRFLTLILITLTWLLPNIASAAFTCTDGSGSPCDIQINGLIWDIDCAGGTCTVCDLDNDDPLNSTSYIFNGPIVVAGSTCNWTEVIVQTPGGVSWVGVDGGFREVELTAQSLEVENETWGASHTTFNISGDVTVRGDNTGMGSFIRGHIDGNLLIENYEEFYFDPQNLTIGGDLTSIGTYPQEFLKFHSYSGTLSIEGNFNIYGKVISKASTTILGKMIVQHGQYEFKGNNPSTGMGLTVNGVVGDPYAIETTDGIFVISCGNTFGDCTLKVGQDKKIRFGVGGLFYQAANNQGTISGPDGGTWNGVLIDRGGMVSCMGGQLNLRGLDSNATAIEHRLNLDPTFYLSASTGSCFNIDSGKRGIWLYGSPIDYVYLPISSTGTISAGVNGATITNVPEPIVIEDILSHSDASFDSNKRVQIFIAGNTINGLGSSTNSTAIFVRNVHVNKALQVYSNTINGSTNTHQSTGIKFIDVSVGYSSDRNDYFSFTDNIVSEWKYGLIIDGFSRIDGGISTSNLFGLIIDNNELAATENSLNFKGISDKTQLINNSFSHIGLNENSAPLFWSDGSGPKITFGGSSGIGNCFNEPNEAASHIFMTSPPADPTCTYNGFDGVPRVDATAGFLCLRNTEQACGIADACIFDCLIEQECVDDQGVNSEDICQICDPQTSQSEWTDVPNCVNGCEIAGVVYQNGDPNPDNSCEYCDVAAAPNDWTSVLDYTSCTDENICTKDDFCLDGKCKGTDVDCSHLDSYCSKGICREEADGCTIQGLNEGLSCNDGLFCTINDTCQDGSCTGPQRFCPAEQCNTVRCDEATQSCVATPAENVRSCDDGSLCTTNDTCVNGECKGDDVVCIPPGQCQVGGTCSELTGQCVYANATNGTSCNDGDNCSLGDRCVNGTCTPALHANCEDVLCKEFIGCDTGGQCLYANVTNGTSCDSNYCMLGETCQNGHCSWGGNIRDCIDLWFWDCIDYICDPISEGCMPEARPINSECLDNSACNGHDWCDSNGNCSNHEYPDGIPDDCKNSDTCIDRHSGLEITIGDSECAEKYCRDNTLSYECECDVEEAHLNECGFDYAENFCYSDGYCKEGYCWQGEPALCKLWLQQETGFDWETELEPCSIITCDDSEGLSATERCYLNDRAINGTYRCPTPDWADPCARFDCQETDCDNANNPIDPDHCQICARNGWLVGEICGNGAVCTWFENMDRSLCLPFNPQTTTLGTGGGSATHSDGAMVEIPDGALSQSTEIMISPADYAPDYVHPIGPVFRFGPAGQSFNTPVTVTLPFDENLVNPNFAITAFWTAEGDEESWEPIGGERIGSGLWQVDVTHFSLGVVGMEATLCPMGCKISLKCYNAGERNPENDCEWCDPAQSVVSWSTFSIGTQCTDYNPCTVGDSCAQGNCIGYEKTCPPLPSLTHGIAPGTVLEDACWTYTSNECSQETGECEHWIKDDGEACNVFDACYEATCQVGVCVKGERRECENTICGNFDCNSLSGECELVDPQNDGQQCQEPTTCAEYKCGNGDCLATEKPGSDGESCGDGKVCEDGFCVEKGCGCNGDPLTLVRVADASDGRSHDQNWKKQVDALLSILVLSIMALGLTIWRRRSYRRFVD